MRTLKIFIAENGELNDIGGVKIEVDAGEIPIILDESQLAFLVKDLADHLRTPKNMTVMYDQLKVIKD